MKSFDAFWELYPRKVAKAAARRSWAKALKKAEPDIITEALWMQLRAGMFADEMLYRPHAATWLNNERWEDELVGGAAVDPLVAELARDYRAACQAGSDRAKRDVQAKAARAGVEFELVRKEILRQRGVSDVQ